MGSPATPVKYKTPIEEAIGRWIETPKSYFNFIRQCKTILGHPAILRDLGASKLEGWSSPLSYTLKGAAIMVLLVQGFVFLLSLATSNRYVSVSKLSAGVQARAGDIANQVIKLEQNRDDVSGAPSDTQFTFPDSPDSFSRDEALNKIDGEINTLKQKQETFQGSIRTLTWEGRIDSAWKSIILPLTMILAALVCRRKIARFIRGSGPDIDSAYLYLATSHLLLPNICAGFLLVLLKPAMASDNGIVTWVFYGCLTLSGLWYWYSLGVVGSRLSGVLGITDAASQEKVHAAVRSANTVLVVASQISFQIFSTLTNTATKSLH